MRRERLGGLQGLPRRRVLRRLLRDGAGVRPERTVMLRRGHRLSRQGGASREARRGVRGGQPRTDVLSRPRRDVRGRRSVLPRHTVRRKPMCPMRRDARLVTGSRGLLSAAGAPCTAQWKSVLWNALPPRRRGRDRDGERTMRARGSPLRLRPVDGGCAADPPVRHDRSVVSDGHLRERVLPSADRRQMAVQGGGRGVHCDEQRQRLLRCSRSQLRRGDRARVSSFWNRHLHRSQQLRAGLLLRRTQNRAHDARPTNGSRGAALCAMQRWRRLPRLLARRGNHPRRMSELGSHAPALVPQLVAGRYGVRPKSCGEERAALGRAAGYDRGLLPLA